MHSNVRVGYINRQVDKEVDMHESKCVTEGA